MTQITYEEMVKRTEYVGQIAEAELFEAACNGGYSDKLKEAIHETQIHRLLRPKRYGGLGMTQRTVSDVVKPGAAQRFRCLANLFHAIARIVDRAATAGRS